VDYKSPSLRVIPRHIWGQRHISLQSKQKAIGLCRFDIDFLRSIGFAKERTKLYLMGEINQ